MENLSILRHTVLPSNAKSNNTYAEYDTVDFNLDFSGRKMLGNTLKLSGRLQVRDNGDEVTGNDYIFFDHTIGAHNFIDTLTISTERQGIIESLQGYARYVGMHSDCTETQNTLGGNLSRVAELKTFAPALTKNLLVQGEKNPGAGAEGSADEYDDPSFILMPDCCLNKMQGVTDPLNVTVSYTKTGSIRLSVRVARVNEALYGSTVSPNTVFSLVDLKAHFMSVAEDNKPNEVLMEIKNHVKQTLLSKQSNVSVRVPMLANAFSASFLEASKENDGLSNTHEREALNDLKHLQFLFNNNTMDLITYEMDNKAEILRQYLNSMGSGRLNQVKPYNTNSNKHYGVGLSFLPVDLTNNSFNVQLEAEELQDTPYIMYCYFKGVLSL